MLHLQHSFNYLPLHPQRASGARLFDVSSATGLTITFFYETRNFFFITRKGRSATSPSVGSYLRARVSHIYQKTERGDLEGEKERDACVCTTRGEMQQRDAPSAPCIPTREARASPPAALASARGWAPGTCLLVAPLLMGSLPREFRQ